MAPARVTKRGSSDAAGPARMTTRQRSRRAAEVSTGGAGPSKLQQMVNEVTSMSAAESGEAMEADALARKEEQVFPLMQLPPEIRNEIYRSCLTRPFSILLSRKAPPLSPLPEPAIEDTESPSDASSTTIDEDADDIDLVTAAAIRTDMNPAPGSAASNTRSNSSPGPSRPRTAQWSTRSTRAVRLVPGRRAQASTSTSSDTDTTSGSNSPAGASQPNVIVSGPNSIPAALSRTSARRNPVAPKTEPVRRPRPQDADPLLVAILRVNRTVYHEARSILYSENHFTLDLDTAMPTISALHQRSRTQIKHVELEIPCYNEILERFQDTIRLSLRYCWSLQRLVIRIPFTFPRAEESATPANWTVYANGFDILRWLPRKCEVVVEGNVCEEIERVVSRNKRLAEMLDEVCYHSRQKPAGHTGMRCRKACCVRCDAGGEDRTEDEEGASQLAS